MWMRLSRLGIKLWISFLCIFGVVKFELWKVVLYVFFLLLIVVVEKVFLLRNGFFIYGGVM